MVIMSDIAAIITSIVGALGTVGAGIAWLSRRIDARFKKVEAELAECRARETAATNREHRLEVALRETAARHLTVIELLWQDVERRSRGALNPVLVRARKLLDDLKEDATHD
jgi:hypothetical protein